MSGQEPLFQEERAGEAEEQAPAARVDAGPAFTPNLPPSEAGFVSERLSPDHGVGNALRATEESPGDLPEDMATEHDPAPAVDHLRSTADETAPVDPAEGNAPASGLRVTPKEERPRRPVVALMGEFSAGKSTLSNLLIGTSALPVNVTATQLPPVWISKGTETPFRVGVDHEEYDIDVNDLEAVSVEDTSHIRIFHDAKLLEICDLIDMPGISDPNMAAAVWQRVIHNADIVIWCSHATQAWRQSEAAVWSTLPPTLYEKSILLLTRMDKILSERDRVRVVKRVESETKGLFRQVLPVSLIRALEANHSPDAWADSGADALMELLVGLIDEVANGEAAAPVPRVRSKLLPAADVESSIGEEVKPKKPRMVMPTRVRPRPLQG